MLKQFFIISVVLCLESNIASAAVVKLPTQPIGYWQTIDDVTHKPKALIQLYLDKNQTLSGKIVQLYEPEDSAVKKRCTACKGEKYNLPIVGLEILNGLKIQDDHSWSEGKILDPKNGQTYNCTLTLKNQGKELLVRGYVGLPLLGRTQIWIRHNTVS